ncbi:hypothetical protein ACN27J_19535 [Solwaraspora sp. WMMB762]|uniref:hypothetical protein n=1 Tax=Solwaraspora sp. WMMB762 TaxID=3404120 RepID=UPI003B94726F
MSYRLRVHPGIAPQWERLAADGPMLTTPGWLRAMAGRLGGRTLTFVVEQGDAACLALHATVQPVPRPGEVFDLHHVLVSEAPALPLTDASRAARAELSRRAAPEPSRWTPNLLVMLPGYECLPVGPAATSPAALAVAVDGILDWAADAGIATVAFLYTRPEATALTGALSAAGFVAMPLSLTWELPVPSGGFDAYLASLPRKRAAEAGRELARLTANGVRLRHLPADAIPPVVPVLARLRGQLVSKYRGGCDEVAERGRLESLLHDVADGRAQVILADAGDAVVGFALFAPFGDGWQCLALGYDYTDRRSRFAYFGTAFYGAVPLASAQGVRRIGYGQGAARAKQDRGCVGTPLTAWLHSTDPELMATARAAASATALIPGQRNVLIPASASPARRKPA